MLTNVSIWGLRCYPVLLVALDDLTSRDEGKEATEADVPSLLSVSASSESLNSKSNCSFCRTGPVASLCQERSGLSSYGFQSSPRVTSPSHPPSQTHHTVGPARLSSPPHFPHSLMKCYHLIALFLGIFPHFLQLLVKFHFTKGFDFPPLVFSLHAATSFSHGKFNPCLNGNGHSELLTSEGCSMVWGIC